MQAQRSFSRYKLDEGCYAGKNVWFLKATRFNWGRGIYVFDTIEKMKMYIAEMKDGDKEEKITSPIKKPCGITS